MSSILLPKDYESNQYPLYRNFTSSNSLIALLVNTRIDTRIAELEILGTIYISVRVTASRISHEICLLIGEQI